MLTVQKAIPFFGDVFFPYSFGICSCILLDERKEGMAGRPTLQNTYCARPSYLGLVMVAMVDGQGRLSVR